MNNETSSIMKLKRSLEVMTNLAAHFKDGGETDSVCEDEIELANKLIDENGGREFSDKYECEASEEKQYFYSYHKLTDGVKTGYGNGVVSCKPNELQDRITAAAKCGEMHLISLNVIS